MDSNKVFCPQETATDYEMDVRLRTQTSVVVVAVGTIVLQHSAVGNPFIYCKHVFGDDLLGIGA